MSVQWTRFPNFLARNNSRSVGIPLKSIYIYIVFGLNLTVCIKGKENTMSEPKIKVFWRNLKISSKL